MSKDKYRPSITDKEVVKTSPEEIIPASTRNVGTSTGGGVEPTPELDELEPAPGKDAPAGLKVVSQKVYYSPEGQQFVEVTFEWDDLPGAEGYMLRVTRA